MAPQELNYYKFISADPAAQSQHVLMMLDYFGDSRAEQPQCHMVFEYLDDSLFRVFQNRRGLIEHRSVVRYTHQICKGLAFLHQTGIAHMDLSMANILLRRDEIVKICDLGCSTPAAGMLSFESEQVSTEYVRAPEVWLGGSHPGSPCDIWGLGVITVALLTGTILFYVGSQDVPWKPGPVPEEKRRAARPATPEPFMRQMVVLGPPTEATWPGCSALPRFDLYVSKQEMSGTQTGVDPLGDALGNPPVVRRPLATSDRGVLLLRRLLVWTPGDRGTAVALLDDSFVRRRSLVGPSLRDCVGPGITGGFGPLGALHLTIGAPVVHGDVPGLGVDGGGSGSARPDEPALGSAGPAASVRLGLRRGARGAGAVAHSSCWDNAHRPAGPTAGPGRPKAVVLFSSQR